MAVNGYWIRSCNLIFFPLIIGAVLIYRSRPKVMDYAPTIIALLYTIQMCYFEYIMIDTTINSKMRALCALAMI